MYAGRILNKVLDSNVAAIVLSGQYYEDLRPQHSAGTGEKNNFKKNIMALIIFMLSHRWSQFKR